MLRFIDRALSDGAREEIETAEESDMLQHELVSFQTIPLLALKLTLLILYDFELSEFPRKREVANALRAMLPEDFDLQQVLRLNQNLNQNGNFDFSVCYTTQPTYDNFVMAYLYQKLVSTYMSRFLRNLEGAEFDNPVPELFFHGPLFHYICYQLTHSRDGMENEVEQNDVPAPADIEHRTTAEHSRAELLQKLNSDRVIFISGETGCGKVNGFQIRYLLI